MTTPKLDQAREWADRRRNISDSQLNAGVKAAAEVIQSLPDQIIDAEKVRELLHWREVVEQTPIKSTEAHLIAWLHALLTPSLPTLAELIEAGNKPEDYQWAWVDTEDGLQVITMAGDFDDKQVYIMDKDGYRFAKYWSEIRPRPDLQRLEWPGSEPEETHFDDLPDEVKSVIEESIEDYRAGNFVDFDSSPRPEDVPAGEPWIVEYDDREWIGCRNDSETRLPWSVICRDYNSFNYCYDVEINLVSRLVPEVAS